MVRPAYDPGETYRYKATAFPFTEATEVDANVVTVKAVDATTALESAVGAGLTTYTAAKAGDKMDLLDTIAEDA